MYSNCKHHVIDLEVMSHKITDKMLTFDKYCLFIG